MLYVIGKKDLGLAANVCYCWWLVRDTHRRRARPDRYAWEPDVFINSTDFLREAPLDAFCHPALRRRERINVEVQGRRWCWHAKTHDSRSGCRGYPYERVVLAFYIDTTAEHILLWPKDFLSTFYFFLSWVTYWSFDPVSMTVCIQHGKSERDRDRRTGVSNWLFINDPCFAILVTDLRSLTTRAATALRAALTGSGTVQLHVRVDLTLLSSSCSIRTRWSHRQLQSHDGTVS